jgi:hypothetical protein
MVELFLAARAKVLLTKNKTQSTDLHLLGEFEIVWLHSFAGTLQSN